MFLKWRLVLRWTAPCVWPRGRMRLGVWGFWCAGPRKDLGGGGPLCRCLLCCPEPCDLGPHTQCPWLVPFVEEAQQVGGRARTGGGRLRNPYRGGQRSGGALARGPADPYAQGRIAPRTATVRSLALHAARSAASGRRARCLTLSPNHFLSRGREAGAPGRPGVGVGSEGGPWAPGHSCGFGRGPEPRRTPLTLCGKRGFSE